MASRAEAVVQELGCESTGRLVGCSACRFPGCCAALRYESLSAPATAASILGLRCVALRCVAFRCPGLHSALRHCYHRAIQPRQPTYSLNLQSRSLLNAHACPPEMVF
ncbi:hypothetical protein CCMA1212_005627 [Trichoderma ghanense]|uniref:Uncharacterized protein n=1 Tax=Trichoderma ghanense TaxID=65468 RepID=A0ABY2H4N8_9HYPO